MGKNKTKKRTRRPNKGWLAGSSATQTICSSFLLVIAVGTLLLTLPISSRTGRLGVIDAMFTATSATCVTGLVVRDTWSQFSLFGQVIILMLIQVGGLGLVTLTSFFALAARRRMGFRDLRLLGESVSADGLSKATEVLKIVIKRLLTDLDKLQEKDQFYLHVLDEVLAYEVDQIKVVEPDNISDIFIEDGKDYVTLVTAFGVSYIYV